MLRGGLCWRDLLGSSLLFVGLLFSLLIRLLSFLEAFVQCPEPEVCLEELGDLLLGSFLLCSFFLWSPLGLGLVPETLDKLLGGVLPRQRGRFLLGGEGVEAFVEVALHRLALPRQAGLLLGSSLLCLLL